MIHKSVIAAAIINAAILTVSPAYAAQYNYTWPGDHNSGVSGSYTLTNGVLGKVGSGCDEYGIYYLNGQEVTDSYSNETSGEFFQSGHLQVWCNDHVADPISSAWCYARFNAYTNGTREGFWGTTPAPICIGYAN